MQTVKPYWARPMRGHVAVGLPPDAGEVWIRASTGDEPPAVELRYDGVILRAVLPTRPIAIYRDGVLAFRTAPPLKTVEENLRRMTPD